MKQLKCYCDRYLYTMATKITEEQHLEKEWFKEAHEQTIESLPKFINHVMNDYDHDYGTICHAISACAIAAAWAANKHEQGGITGFQAGFIMWDCIEQWMFTNNKTALRIINYDDMLYPQYEKKFDKVISRETFESIQKAAKDLLDEYKSTPEDRRCAHPDVVKHWKSIIDGNVPFGYKIKED